MAPLIAALVVAVFAILLVASAVRIVRQSHAGMLERFGKYRRTLPPGLHIVVPLLDRIPVIVDMREIVQPFAPQPVSRVPSVANRAIAQPSPESVPG